MSAAGTTELPYSAMSITIPQTREGSTEILSFTSVLPYPVRVGQEGLEPPDSEENDFTGRTATNYGLLTIKCAEC